MKYYIIYYLLGFLLISCSENKNTADRSYTFDSYDQDLQSLFIISSNDDPVEIEYSNSSRKENRELIQMMALQSFINKFDLREIKFINEQEVLIKYYASGDLKQEQLQINQSMIIVPELTGQYLNYNKAKDQFDLCGLSFFALNGPNSTVPDSIYNRFILWECENSLNEAVLEFLEVNDYRKLDTLDIITNRLYYK